jgi:hypothetical protein
MRSTKYRSKLDRSITIDALDITGLDNEGSSTSHNTIGLQGLLRE